MFVYPIFLNDLHRRRCVVFGGNHEAERKVDGLLECDAHVEVIAIDVTDRLETLAGAGRIRWQARDYVPGDLRNAFLAIVAETNPAKTHPIWQEAERERVLLNAMDDVRHCSFVAGSVVRQGALVVAISTTGAAPALSVRLREEFQGRFGPEYADFLEWMLALREPMALNLADFNERRRRWYELVDSDILDLLRDGREADARRRVVEILGEAIAGPFLGSANQ